MDGNNGQTSTNELKELIVKLTEKIENYDESIKSILKKVSGNTTDIGLIKKENNDIREGVKKQEESVKKLNKEIDFFKRNARNKNLILYNIPDTDDLNNNLFNEVMSILADIEVKDYYIDNIRRLGQVKGKRPVVITLVTARYKKMFFENAELLIEKHGIVLANDASKQEREEYKKLKMIQQKLEKMDIEAHIKKNKIVIGKKIFDSIQATSYIERFEEHRFHDEQISDSHSDCEATTVTGTKKKRDRETSITPVNKNTKKKKDNGKKTA